MQLLRRVCVRCVACIQVLALFNKAVRKLCSALRAVQEKGIEAEINTTTGTILQLYFILVCSASFYLLLPCATQYAHTCHA
jgi:hypothetical protein